MKREQLSHRIGNIEDRLVEQAENAPNFGHQRHNRNIRRMVLIAAVISLMAGSFIVGAVAMNKDPEIIYEVVEEIVYVEKEQEIIIIDNYGISIILPDDWAGKYGYELDGNNLAVYLLAQREDKESDYKDAGYLFWIDCLDEVYPMDYIYPEPGYTIATTATNTYRLRRASDVQYDIRNTAIAEEYAAMNNSISNIQILLTDWLTDNSTNASNWVEGTVTVQFFENYAVVKTVVCDEEQSRIIRNIMESQTYGQPGNFNTDLTISFNGDKYLLNSDTGDIMIAAGLYSSVLSAEDLSTVMDLLSD